MTWKIPISPNTDGSVNSKSRGEATTASNI